MALTLHKSLVLPHLDYFDTICMTATNEALHKLQLVQNLACRTLLSADRYASTNEMHEELGRLPLECRRKSIWVVSVTKLCTQTTELVSVNYAPD